MGAASILADIAEAEAAVSAGRLSPPGVLRVTSTIAFGRRHVVTAALAERYPEAGIRRSTNDGIAGLVGGGFDLAVRGWVGRPEQTDLIIHRIAANRRVVCDAPAYRARGHALHNAESLPPSCLVIARQRPPP